MTIRSIATNYIGRLLLYKANTGSAHSDVASVATVPHGTSGMTNHEPQSKSIPMTLQPLAPRKAKITMYFPVTTVLGSPRMPVKSSGKVSTMLSPP